MIANVNRKIER